MFEFALPDVGEGVSEGEIVAWHVAPGDRVAEDDVLAEVETDKAIVDLPAPVDGVVRELHAQEGDVVPVGDIVITIEEDGEDGAPAKAEGGADAGSEGGPEQGAEREPATAAGTDDVGPAEAAEPATTAGSGRVFAPPRVRRLARELGVDLTAVEGSGPSGRVTESDVRASAEGASGAGSEGGVAAETGAESAGAPEEATEAVAPGEAVAATAGEPAARERTLAVPATRALADELGVDIDRVPTDRTREGEPFVDAEAVRAFAEASAEGEASTTGAGAGTEPAAAGNGTTVGTGPAGNGAARAAEAGGAGGERREPYRGIRRTIGERMAASDDAVPRATHHDSVVVTELVETREQLRERAEARGVRLTYLPFVLKAVAAGLREHPVLNTRLDEESEEIVYHDAANLGVATATDDGLLVPVVKNVGEKGLLTLAEEVGDLVERARRRELEPAEMRGGTFSVTNFGAIGGEYATPIVNHPETAILGLGGIERRPVVEGDEVVPRHTLPLSLAIDHRVIDGADAARFANTVMDYLREPSLLLLE